MPLPRLAIVGRPNVGKSSLLNMIAHRRVSIVDDTPGTTRDRVTTVVTLEPENNEGEPVHAELTDTGGFGVYTVEGRRIDDAGKDLAALTDDIEQQIAKGVREADLILFVIDAQAGLTAQDREVARLLREGGLGPQRKSRSGEQKAGSGAANVLMIANKCDGPRWEADAAEASAFGFGEPMMVSARNNYRRRELIDRLHKEVKAIGTRRRLGDEVDHPDMMLAIVGKRNAGKSTLVNTLAGEDRVIVSEIAGTTRDAVDVKFELDGKRFVAIDTAGLRKKKSFQDRIEWWALDRCKQAINRADVALLLVDAKVPISQIDQQLGHMLAASYKPVVIVVNKWDLAEGRPIAGSDPKKIRPVTTGDYEEYIRSELKGLDFAPIAFISAKASKNIRETIHVAFEMLDQARSRVNTGKLNRMLREIIRRQGPTSKIGSFAKILYTAQIRTSPPTIVCVVNKPELFTPNYQRFLMNRFREELPFSEVPIKLIIRARKRDDVIEQEDGSIARVAEEREDAGEILKAAMESADADYSQEALADPGSFFDEPPAQPMPDAPARLAESDAPRPRKKKAPVRARRAAPPASAPPARASRSPAGARSGPRSTGPRTGPRTGPLTGPRTRAGTGPRTGAGTGPSKGPSKGPRTGPRTGPASRSRPVKPGAASKKRPSDKRASDAAARPKKASRSGAGRPGQRRQRR